MLRVSSTQQPSGRDPALDGLRGAAVLLVFLFHYGGGLRAHNPLLRAVGHLTEFGWVGVNVFFALSGYLITGILVDGFGRRDALPHFYARRALRIFPLYYAALLACAVAAVIGGAGMRELGPLLVYAAFLQNWPSLLVTALHAPPPLPLHHLWSLAVEEQFYLVWPFLLLRAGTLRRQLHLCWWTFAVSCAVRVLLFTPALVPQALAQSFAVCLPVRAGALALGAALALHVRRHPGPPVVRWAVAAAMLGLATLLGVGLLTGSLLLRGCTGFLISLPAADLLAAAVVALSLAPTALRQALGTPALGFLGRISYGFYVFHILLEPLFDRLGSAATHSTTGFGYQAVRLVVAFFLTLAVAWLSFVLLETPFLRWKRRFPQTPVYPLPAMDR